jgi:hypothetical protein
MKPHEETIRLIDKEVWVFGLHLRQDSDDQLWPLTKDMLRRRIDELEKTKVFLLKDQEKVQG